MANHIRTQIRARAVTLLTGLSTTGSRVFANQFYNVAPTECPCLLIYTPEDDTSQPPPRCHPGELRHVITLNVEGIATGTGNLSNTVDQIAKEVEAALATDFTLNGLAHEMQLLGSNVFNRGGDSPQPIASVVMRWQIVTSTLEGVPDVVT